MASRGQNDEENLKASIFLPVRMRLKYQSILQIGKSSDSDGGRKWIIHAGMRDDG